MSIKEFRDILQEELKNGNGENSTTILTAKQELLNDETTRVENFEILNTLKGHTLNEQILILNDIINQDTHKNNTIIDNRDGYTNIILLSISLIIIVIIIFAIIIA